MSRKALGGVLPLVLSVLSALSALLARPAAAQIPRLPVPARPALPALERVRFIAGAGVGVGSPGIDLQVEATPADAALSYGLDALRGQDAWIVSLSAVSGLTKGRSEPAIYGGAGLGLAAAGEAGGPTLLVRLGLELPLGADALALRVEGRTYLLYWGGVPFLMIALRVP